MSSVELFCHVDDFCQVCEPRYRAELKAAGLCKRCRTGKLCPSEILTILIRCHLSHDRDFNAYDLQRVCQYQRAEFPGLVSDSRFVALIPYALIPLCAYLRSLFGRCTACSFIDATPLAAPRVRRSGSARQVLNRLVLRFQGASGLQSPWRTAGFHAHPGPCPRHQGAAQAGQTPVGRRGSRAVRQGFGDRGYFSEAMFRTWFESYGVPLVTKLRRNLKNQLMPLGGQAAFAPTCHRRDDH